MISSFILLLSARNTDRLREYAKLLLYALKQGAYTEAQLPGIAYTLQTGREAMEERLAFSISNLPEGITRLEAFLAGVQLSEQCYTGNVKEYKENLSAMLQEADMNAMIAGWLLNNKQDQLMTAWCKGFPIDWEGLYTNAAGESDYPQKVSLPGYPFDRKHYWISEQHTGPIFKTANAVNAMQAVNQPAAPVVTPAASKPARVEEPFQLMTYAEGWQEKQITGATASIKRLVCFASESSCQQTFLATLQQLAPTVQVIFVTLPGNAAKGSNPHYTITQKADGADYAALFGKIIQEQGAVDAIVYLWPLEDAGLLKDYDIPVAILQGIAGRKIAIKQILLAAQWMTQQDSINLDRCYAESWIGFERSLKLILPGVQLTAVYEETVQPTINISDWTKRIWDELNSTDKRSVLYKQGIRHVQQVQAVALQAGDKLLTRGGTYLITGGMGKLGLLFARHLAKQYAANLILTGRSAPGTAGQQAIQALKQLGSQVFFLQAAIDDTAAMQQGLREAREIFGPIHGVIHAAGTMDTQLLPDKTMSAFQQVLNPKVKGTILLDELLKDDPLQFISYFTSSAAILGDFGACDYAIANRFQMAFAHSRGQLVTAGHRHGKTIAINWPLWKEGGMDLQEEENTRLYLKSSGQRYLESAEGIELFEQLITQPAAQLLVIAGQESKARRFLGITSANEVKLPTAPVTTNVLPPAKPKGSHLKMADALEQDLITLVSRAQQIPEAELLPDDNLADIGFDSISLTELARLLGVHFGISMAPAIFFGYSTIRKLTEYFLKEQASVVEAFYNNTSSEISAPVEETAIAMPQAPVIPPPTIAPAPAARSVRTGSYTPEPIAVIGMSGRFPGVRTTAELWEVLASGKDVVEEIPLERFDWRPYYSNDANATGKTNCKWSGLVPGAYEFDPAFFGISPKEAETMDPRQRLLLQEAWNALEDAGYGPAQINNSRVGLFVGAEESGHTVPAADAALTSTHNGILAARLSYFMNLSGPNMAINTACSSGLVATHQAFQSLQTGECDTALAAGVNLMYSPELYVGMTQAGMLSDDGKCFAFDKRANGMVPAEAVVVVVLKRLSDAQADGDAIYATVEASGINYDGKTNGITAPNGLAQAALFKSVYERFGIHPGSIEYMVTHGTGTRLGDPVEVNALHEAFKTYTDKQSFCAITSAKSNIGHSFAASGLVNMVNLVQAFRHEAIPASLHCAEASDYINWQDTAFYVNSQQRPWSATPGKERLGGISAFGMSGTNAHMVLQSYTAADRQPEPEGRLRLLVLSAKTPAALQARVSGLMQALENNDTATARLSDITYTLLAGRHHFKYRAACIVDTRAGAIQLLKRLDGKQKASRLFQGEVLRDFKERSSISRYIANLARQCSMPANDAAALEEDLAALADLFCQGYDIPANCLYENSNARRIHLPAYPFAREEYRIQTPQVTTTNHHPVVEDRGNNLKKQETNDHSLMTFEETWQETAITSNIAATAINTLVCFLHDSANQELISDQLRSLHPQVNLLFVVAPGSQESQTNQWPVYWLEGKDEAAYKDVLRRIQQAHGIPDAMLYLYALEDSRYHLDYFPLFAITRAIYTEQLTVKQFMVSGSWLKGSVDSAYLQSWTGLERTARTVLPQTRVSCVLFEEDTAPLNMGQCFNRLGQELQASGNNTVLYRNNQRFTSQVQEYTLSAGQTLLKQGGTYLITGGCGGLGLIIATHLAKRYSAQLVLLGRSPLDASKETALQDLQALGSQVLYVQADVSDEVELQTAITSIRNQFGPIQGVIHAAGVAGDKTIFNQDYGQFGQVLQPKVLGTVVLDRLLAQEQLDFMCYFSSGTAILGDFGTCNYAIGNRFQMGYAHYRHELVQAGQRQGKTVVINWPLWKEGGMHLDEDTLTDIFLRSTGQRLLHTAEGLALFEQLLAQPASQVLVLAGKPDRLRQMLGINPVTEPAVQQDPLEAAPARSLRKKEMNDLDIEQCIEWDLKNQVHQLLKIAAHKIDRYENLVDIGFDSISLTQLAKSLSAHYGLELLPAVFFGYPTIEKLGAYLWQEHKAFMQGVYRSTKLVPAVPQATPGDVADRSTPANTSKAPVMPVVSVPPLPGIPEPIAIIGMSGRFAGARDIESMWQALAGGQDAVEEIPRERFDWRPYYSTGNMEGGKTNCKWSGLVPGIDEFDPLFFEIPPKQAATMDPRQRLLLQEAWKALEDAGYGAEQLKTNKTGMYVGAEESMYASLVGNEGNLTGNNNAILAARLSYFLNLSGPNMAINTACSSGLVAVHQACLSLRSFECDTAIAAAVNLLFTPEPYIAMSEAGMLSPQGKCYSFDKRANGMVPGEAVTVVVLKRLSKAIADGDPIYATIAGSGLNYDGKTNGITAPSGLAQTNLLRSVYDQCQVNPAHIDYIVTHGTGTPLGDAVEISALQDAFKPYTNQQSYCALTSSKTNFGHTLAASGMVSMIGLVQSFRYNTIPASLHCTEENNHINWTNSPFYVNKQSKPWLSEPGKERLGAVSAFGMSGTNAHLVLQSYTALPAHTDKQEPSTHLLVLSAKSPAALKDKLLELAQAMASGPLAQAKLTDIAYTLLTGRHHFRYRCAAVAATHEDAIRMLQQLAREEKDLHLFYGEVLNESRNQSTIKEYINNLARQIHQQPVNGAEEGLAILAGYYCQGYELPAALLYEPFGAQRTHLPTYPFAREKYWVKQSPASSPAAVQQVTAVAEVPQVEEVTIPAAPVPEKKASNGNGHAKTNQYLVDLLSAVTGLPTGIIDADTSFTSYGIDSILIMQLKNKLEAVAGELPTNLFFEYTTIRSLGQYFINEHPGLLNETVPPTNVAETLPDDLVAVLQRDPLALHDYLTTTIADALGIAKGSMEPTLRLEYYGVDSILMVQLKNSLEKVFGNLPASLLFEYPTIQDLVAYFSGAATGSPLLVTEEQNN
jgi:polyketide synthase PksN